MPGSLIILCQELSGNSWVKPRPEFRDASPWFGGAWDATVRVVGLTTKAQRFLPIRSAALFRLSYLADHHAGPFP
jgi:hypothetical protein